jgi:hypothetical protein
MAKRQRKSSGRTARKGFPFPIDVHVGGRRRGDLSPREVHWAKPELVAGFEMMSWTNDGVIRQASLQEVRERSDEKLRPDWINLPEHSER